MKLKNLILNFLLFLSVLLVCFIILEMGTRILDKGYVRRWLHVMPDKIYSFYPGSLGEYKSDEYEFTIQANRFGRRDKEWSDADLKDPSNILFIGDSFVAGYGVNDEQSIPTLLEQHYESRGISREVLNFALSWSFPEYIQLLHEANQIGVQAKTVLVGIFIGNDFSPQSLAVGDNEPFQGRMDLSLNHSKFLSSIKKRLKGSPFVVGILFRVANLFNLEIYQSPAGYIFFRDQTEQQKERFYRILSNTLTLEQLARSQGREVKFILFPNKVQVENFKDLNRRMYQPDKPNQMIMAYCHENSLDCFDLLPALRNAYESNAEKLYYPIDRHFTPLGNRLAAEFIFEDLYQSKAKAHG